MVSLKVLACSCALFQIIPLVTARVSTSRKPRLLQAAKCHEPIIDCYTVNQGYKQLNTVLSLAFQTIIKDGRYRNILMYNAGFPGGTYSPTYVEDFDQCDAYWDRNEMPVGVLEDIIHSGTIKWCIHGGRSLPGFGVAEADNFLQGVTAGEYYGTFVDRFHALTNAMSDTLHAELVPEFVVVDVTEAGFFDDMAGALESGICHATLDVFFRHPYRELVVDFTCKTRDISQGYGALGLSSTDLSVLVETKGENATACSAAGTTQAALLARDFPLASVVDVSSVEDMTRGLCNEDCDVTIGALGTTSGIPECVGLEFAVLQVANPSSAGDVAAISYRPPICT